MTYRIGIDSGGTHITAIAYADKKEIATAQSGPGNIFLNPDQTVQNLVSVVKDIVNTLPNDKCECILIGIAGLETLKDSYPYLNKVKDSLANVTFNINFISDAKLALISGLKGKDGFLAIAGTGSIVYGKHCNKYIRAGGWGYLLDDIGSGYRISQEAVSDALSKFDRGEKSTLTDAILNYFHGNNLKEVVSNYYQLDRKEIAGFSKEIGKLAEENNGDAIKVLKHQGNLLADEIIGLIARCKNNDETANNLALSGSVLVNNTLIKNIIENRVQEEFPDIKVTVSKSSNTDAVNYFKKEE